jgi:dihydroflavonol-4-reductase
MWRSLRRRRGRSLRLQGAELRLLARASSDTSRLPKSAEVVVGDLRAPEGFAAALAGCDALIHVAADYRLWVPDPAEMYKANVEGTRTLLRLAREAGVRRVVYTSSVATMGFHGDDGCG